MPYTNTNQFTVVSYADLHGLGAREGKPVVYTWEPPPPLPPQIAAANATSVKLLFWLLILVPLFLLRRNRPAQAWWLWLPIVISAVAGVGITVPISGSDWSLPQATCALVIGLAAMWLLMPILESRYRLLAFFKGLLASAGFSLLAFLPTLLAQDHSFLDFRPFLAGLLALASLAIMLALTFSSLSVRRRFGRVRFLLWLAAWTVVAWVAIATPFVILGSLRSEIEWGASVLAILYTSAGTLALLLPFVLLSCFQPFYRDRLFGFCNAPQIPPAVEPATPAKLAEVR